MANSLHGLPEATSYPLGVVSGNDRVILFQSQFPITLLVQRISSAFDDQPLDVHNEGNFPLSDLARDPADILIRQNNIDRAIESVQDEKTRKILVYQALGYSLEEVAELLDTTKRAIDSRITRHRRRREERPDEDE